MALTLSHYRFGIDSGTESTHGWHAAEDTVPEVGRIQCDTTFLLRFSVQADATLASNIVNQFQYRVNGGTWTNITTTSTHVKALAAAALTNGGNCTKRLSGTGTFEATAAGQTEDGNSGGTANDIVANGNSETECGLQIVSTAVNLGDLIEFRLTTSPTAISTYAVTPSVKVAKNVSIPTVPTGSVAVTTKAPSRLLAALALVACAACTVTGRAPTRDVAGTADWPFVVPTGAVATTGVNFLAYDEYRSFWGTVPTVEVATGNHEVFAQDGSLAVTGTAPTVRRADQRTVLVGTIQATGATPLLGEPAYVPTVAVAITGTTTVTTLNAIRGPSVGSLALSGTTLTRLTDEQRQPGVATVAVSGTVVGGAANLAVEVPSGAFRTYRNRLPSVVAIPAGSVGITSTAPDTEHVTTVGLGSVAVTGTAPRGLLDHVRPVGVGAVAVTGAIPDLGGALARSVPVGSLALSAIAPTRVVSSIRAPAVLAVDLAGTTPSVLVDARRQLAVRSVSLSGTTPARTIGQTAEITVPTGALRTDKTRSPLVNVPRANVALSGTTPSAVTTSNDHAIEIPAAPSLIWTGRAPTAAGNTTAIEIPTGSLLIVSPVQWITEIRWYPRTGSLGITGRAPTAVVSRQLATGSVAVTGTLPVSVATRSGSAAEPQIASVAVTGVAPTRLVAHVRSVPVATVALTGTGTISGMPEIPATGQVAITGTIPTVVETYVVAPGTVALSGTTPSRVVHDLRTPAVASLALTGTANRLATGANSQTGTVTLSGCAPTRVVAGARTPDVADLAFSLTTPTSTVDAVREVPSARVSVSGTTLSVDRPDRVIPLPVGAVRLTATAPQREGDHQATVPVLELAFSGTVPERGTSARLPVGALHLTGTAVTRQVAHLRQVPVASVTLTGTTHYNVVDLNADFLPGSGEFRGTDPVVVATTDHYLWNVPTGGITVAGTAPTWAQGGDSYRTPAVGTVTLTGTATVPATGPAIAIPTGTATTITGVAPEYVRGTCRAIPVATIRLSPTTPTRLVALRVVQMQFNKATVSPLDRYELWGRAAHPRWSQAYPEQRYVLSFEELTDRGTYYTFWYGDYEVTYTYEVMAYTLKPEGWPGKPKEALAVTVLT